MFNRSIIFITFFFFSAFASAELRPYVHAGVGASHSKINTDVHYDVGLGLAFNENIELEAAYNDFGDVASFRGEITSYSVGLNIGGPIAENLRVFGVLGAEKLEAKGRRYGYVIDASDEKAFFGLGAAYQNHENFEFRTKLIGHDGTDLITFDVGVVFYFR